MEKIKPYLDRDPELLESLATEGPTDPVPTREQVLEGLRWLQRDWFEGDEHEEYDPVWRKLADAITYLEGLAEAKAILDRTHGFWWAAEKGHGGDPEQIPEFHDLDSVRELLK